MNHKKSYRGITVCVLGSLGFFVCMQSLVAQPARPTADFQGTVRVEEYRAPIIFIRAELDERTGEPVQEGKVWVMDEDGSGTRQLTFGPNYDDHPALFSDLRHALYSEFNGTRFDRKLGARLVKLNIYNGASEVFSEVPGCALHHVSLTPEEDKMAYQHDCGDLRTQRVGWGAAGYEINMRAVNPVDAGDSIIFMHQRAPLALPRRAALVRLFGHGKGAKAIFLTDDRHFNRRPAVSPDKKWLAWQTDSAGNDEIFLARTDGSEARNLTNTRGSDGHPWFSRDGQWIVFESDRTGTSEIWKINVESSQQHQLTFGGKKYSSRTPRW